MADDIFKILTGSTAFAKGKKPPKAWARGISAASPPAKTKPKQEAADDVSDGDLFICKIHDVFMTCAGSPLVQITTVDWFFCS